MPDLVVRRLQQFAALNRYKKEARRMLAVFLPEEEVGGRAGTWVDRAGRRSNTNQNLQMFRRRKSALTQNGTAVLS